jgi:hypothetical protein
MPSLTSLDRGKGKLVRSLDLNPGPPHFHTPEFKAAGQRRRGRGGARERCTHTADRRQLDNLVPCISWTTFRFLCSAAIFCEVQSPSLKFHRLEQGLLAVTT